MAKRIVAFSATPRKNGNSDILAGRILAGAAEAGASVEKIRLHELSIQSCNACDACQKSVEEPCVLDDDMAGLLEKIVDADALVLASPVYFFAVNAQMKAFLDRFYALFADGQFDRLKGKPTALALTYGDSDPLSSGVVNAVGMFRDAGKFLGLDIVGCVHASCMAAGEIEANQTALDAAEALGRKLASA